MSCGDQTDGEQTEDLTITSDVPANFFEFYQRFHSDSLFQMDHIQFPLSGVPTMDSSADPENYKWTKANWRMQKMPELSEDTKRTFANLGFVIIERLTIGGVMGTERRFLPVGDSYELIYYAGMQRVR